MSNDLDYKKLISDVKYYYESKPPETQNIKNGGDFFDLIWCDGLVDEINLWTFWQGAGVDNPDVMIIGQDFGTCYDVDNTEFYRGCVKTPKQEYFKRSNEYIHNIQKNPKNITDNNIIWLTNEGLGSRYDAGKSGNKLLFLTNLCLGYRSCGPITGGDIYKNLKHDSMYISRLIEIKMPKVVICIGKDTYMYTVSSLAQDEELKNIGRCFYSLLDAGGNFKELCNGEYKYRIYGVSHPGFCGCNNRKRNSSYKYNSELTGKEIMLSDWKRIGEYLQKL